MTATRKFRSEWKIAPGNRPGVFVWCQKVFNPVSERNIAEAEFLKDGRTWRELWSPSDKRAVAFARRKLGVMARSVEAADNT